MRTFTFSVQTAFKSIWKEKWIYFLTILSISVGLLIISAFLTVTINLDSMIKRWSKSFGLVVYLNENLTNEAEQTLKNFLDHDPDVVKVDYVSKKDALEELREILGTESSVLEDFKSNPLPSSFILTLKKELLTPSYVSEKANVIKQMKGVDEVQYGEQWLSSLSSATDIMKISATFLGISIFIAIIFITYNTIKIFFYRRKEEIETLKLLGATRGFIRLPFLIEGLFIGIVGGLLGTALLFGIQSLISTKGIEFFPSIRAITTTLPYQLYLFLPLSGALMSFIGSFIAVGKIKY